jgi:hypothetical protein
MAWSSVKAGVGAVGADGRAWAGVVGAQNSAAQASRAVHPPVKRPDRTMAGGTMAGG